MVAQDDPKGAAFGLRALHHQNLGLLMYRSALSSMSKDNAPALFAFSMMIAIFAFASPRLMERAPNMDEVLDKFGLMRGSRIVWSSETDTIRTGPTRALLPTIKDADEYVMEPRYAAYVDELEIFVGEEIYASAVKFLRLCLQFAFKAPTEVPMAARWPAQTTDAFWELVMAKDPKALMILAHYGLVLRNYSQTWWLAGWKDILVNSISEALSDAEKEAFGWQDRIHAILYL